MRYLVGTGLVLALALPIGAQGSRSGDAQAGTGTAPVAATGVAGSEAPVATTSTGTGEPDTSGFWRRPGRAGIRVPGFRDGDRTAQQVEFLDAVGHVKRKLEQAPWQELTRWNGRKSPTPLIERLWVSPGGQGVVAFETTEYRGTSKGPWWNARYFDLTGRTRWSAPSCCGDAQAEMSEDGSVVALLDVGEGGHCDLGEDAYTAPRGCVGLRVFVPGKGEVLRVPKGNEVHISPHGGFVVFFDGKVYRQLNLKSRATLALPLADGRLGPVSVEDSGVVSYFHKDGWDPPGTPHFRHVPGKGLERLPDTAHEHVPSSATEGSTAK